MNGRLDVLAVGAKLLEEFLARPNAGKNNIDVIFRPESAQRDHVSGQVDDLDRLAHVQQVYLPALANGGGLEDELGGLGDSHEVPGHVRVGDGHWPAGGDLLSEGRHDRSV